MATTERKAIVVVLVECQDGEERVFQSAPLPAETAEQFCEYWSDTGYLTELFYGPEFNVPEYPDGEVVLP